MASKRQQRRYSDDDRANALAALAANGGNLSQTARQLGIPKGTLLAWRDGAAHPEAVENSTPKKADMAAALKELAWDLLGDLGDQARRQGAGLAQTATALGIVLDKARLLEGKPTQITDNTHRFDDLTDDELDAHIQQLQARAGGGPGSTGSPPGPS